MSGPACWASPTAAGRFVTLLVTSPKAGEGKSTAALNLAATCARAGERTLLLDVDLRRPTLADVFIAGAEKEGRSTAWSMCFEASSPGSGPSAIPRCATSISFRPAIPATSRSRS